MPERSLTPEEQELRHLLRAEEIHERWIAEYRTDDAFGFYEAVFDRLARVIPPGSTVADVGCGTGAHSVRLSRKGYNVVGMDLSESALTRAAEAVAGQQPPVHLVAGDVIGLPFGDSALDVILSWGVLMHVPRWESALDEFSRALRPCGYLILNEVNLHSIEGRATYHLKKTGRFGIKGHATEEGVEYWVDGLLSRQMSFKSLVDRLGRCGFRVEHRWAGQLTAAYSRTSSPRARRLIHSLNLFYFKRIGRPGPALGNIVIARRV